MDELISTASSTDSKGPDDAQADAATASAAVVRLVFPDQRHWPAANDVNIITLGMSDGIRADRRPLSRGAQKAATTVKPRRWLASRHVVVAKTDDEAMTIARHAYAKWENSFHWLWERHKAEPHIDDIYPPTFDDLVEIDNGVAGSPETVRKYITPEIAKTDTNYFVSWMCFGDMAMKEALHSVRVSCSRDSDASRRAASIGTIAASLELRSVSEVLTLRTCGAPVSSVTKA